MSRPKAREFSREVRLFGAKLEPYLISEMFDYVSSVFAFSRKKIVNLFKSLYERKITFLFFKSLLRLLNSVIKNQEKWNSLESRH